MIMTRTRVSERQVSFDVAVGLELKNGDNMKNFSAYYKSIVMGYVLSTTHLFRTGLKSNLGSSAFIRGLKSFLNREGLALFLADEVGEGIVGDGEVVNADGKGCVKSCDCKFGSIGR